MNYLKTTVLNIGIVVIAFGAAWLSREIDGGLGLESIQSNVLLIVGLIVLGVGVLFRLWASYTFYSSGIDVLSLKAQDHIVRAGPYGFSRNPLFIGIILVFLGAVLIIGSLTGLVLVPFVFLFCHVYLLLYEEDNLEERLGDEYREYKKFVPRWL